MNSHMSTNLVIISSLSFHKLLILPVKCHIIVFLVTKGFTFTLLSTGV